MTDILLFRVAIAFFGLGILVFVHELGHFIFAKRSGVGVSKFSVGFWKKIWGFKRGETEYQIAVVPLGGYVKLMGLDDKCDDPNKSFSNKPKLTRLKILAAGVIFNFIFAITIFTYVNMHSFESFKTIVNPVKDTPAAKVLVEGDEIIKVNGVEVSNWREIVVEIMKSQGEPISLTVIRGRRVKEVQIKPVKESVEDEHGKKFERWVIGIKPTEEPFTVPGMPPTKAFVKSLKVSGEVYVMTYVFIGKLFVKKADAKKNLGGPILIITMMSNTVKYGFLSFLHFLGFLSLAIAVFNALPIPILDGGYMMFIGVEAIRGKPLKNETMNYIQLFFLILLGMLMVYVAYLDLTKVL